MINKSTIQCRCCTSRETLYLWKGELIGLDVSYYECQKCGYVQTEQPYWIEKAYSDAINNSDTGIMVRNSLNARLVIVTMQVLGILHGRIVDYGGGYGLLVRLLRDYGVDALWSDPFCSNLVARGFEYNGEGAADLVTAFEAFEHFENPGIELDRLLEMGRNVFFSTEIIDTPAPEQNDWWYYGKEHGQHIGFFRVRTLQRLAESRGKYFVTNGVNYHLVSEKPVNIMYWRLLMKFNKFIALIMINLLESKTWSDHEQQTRVL